MGPKQFWVQKFWVQQNFGSKKFVSEKYFSYKIVDSKILKGGLIIKEGLNFSLWFIDLYEAYIPNLGHLVCLEPF